MDDFGVDAAPVPRALEDMCGGRTAAELITDVGSDSSTFFKKLAKTITCFMERIAVSTLSHDA